MFLKGLLTSPDPPDARMLLLFLPCHFKTFTVYSCHSQLFLRQLHWNPVCIIEFEDILTSNVLSLSSSSHMIPGQVLTWVKGTSKTLFFRSWRFSDKVTFFKHFWVVVRFFQQLTNLYEVCWFTPDRMEARRRRDITTTFISREGTITDGNERTDVVSNHLKLILSPSCRPYQTTSTSRMIGMRSVSKLVLW